MIASVDSDALLELVWAAPLAAFTVTLAWALVVHGSTRATEARRDGRLTAAVLHAVVAAVGVVLFGGAIVLGLVVMTSKG